MPTFNAIQTSRLEKYLKVLLGVRNGGIMPTVAPELGVELHIPAHEDLWLPANYEPWGAGGSINPVAGQNTAVSLINNFSDALIIARFLCGGSATTGNDVCVGVGLAGANPPANNYGFRDTRRDSAAFAAAPLGATIVVTNAVLATPPAGHFRVANILTSTNQQVYSPWVVLRPFAAMVWAQTTVNLSLYWSIEAMTRHVDPDELTT